MWHVQHNSACICCPDNTHADTSDVYGPFTNEELVGKAIKGVSKHTCTPNASRQCASNASRTPELQLHPRLPSRKASSCIGFLHLAHNPMHAAINQHSQVHA
jgi:hypothetical protein